MSSSNISLVFLALAISACAGNKVAAAQKMTPCDFDGRVAPVRFVNDTKSTAIFSIIHPDTGHSHPMWEHKWHLAPQQSIMMSYGDGEVALGNDWLIHLDNFSPRCLGAVADWQANPPLFTLKASSFDLAPRPIPSGEYSAQKKQTPWSQTSRTPRLLTPRQTTTNTMQLTGTRALQHDALTYYTTQPTSRTEHLETGDHETSATDPFSTPGIVE